MKFEADVEEFEAEMKNACGVAKTSKSTTLSILKHVLLEAKDGRLHIHSTDLDTSLSSTMECDIEEEGEVAIQAKPLYDLVKKMKSAHFTIETDENFWADLDGGDISCRVPGDDPDNFPEIFTKNDVTFYKMNSHNFYELVDKTLFAVSTQEVRPNMTGGFFEIVDGQLVQMSSTDGHRAARCSMEIEDLEVDEMDDSDREGFEEGVIIPKHALSQMKKVMSKGDPVGIGLKDNNFVMKQGDRFISARLVEGTFPDLSMVLPNPANEMTCHISRRKLKEGVQFAKVLANKSNKKIQLTFFSDHLEMYARSPENGEGTQEIDCEYDGDEITIGANYSYLADILNTVDGDDLIVKVHGENNPVLIRDKDRKDEFLAILMPIRVSS